MTTNMAMMDTYEKIDSKQNGVVKPEPKGRIYPIRINPSTVFYVTKEKNTPEYAEYLKNKYNTKKGFYG
jgi:hypothetical protein